MSGFIKFDSRLEALTLLSIGTESANTVAVYKKGVEIQIMTFARTQHKRDFVQYPASSMEFGVHEKAWEGCLDLQSLPHVSFPPLLVC